MDEMSPISETHQFSSAKVSYLFNISLPLFLKDLEGANFVIITDENLAALYPFLQNKKVIVLPAGESFKNQDTINHCIEKLLKWGADRNTLLIGVGGGVVTDMTGYVASIFKRGLPLILAPSSVLAMVDASVGGKNGIDVGAYKNMVGTVYQPRQIVFDFSLLQTLPEAERINGFAEIIKHAAIKDKILFKELEKNQLSDYFSNEEKLAGLIHRNVSIKTEVVLNDEFETGDRKLLNFGHTIGHAIENTYGLAHGHAISVGMVLASRLSHQLLGFPQEDVERLTFLLQQYGLTTSLEFEVDKIWNYLLADKKRSGNYMNFILLQQIGNAIHTQIPINELNEHIKKLVG